MQEEEAASVAFQDSRVSAGDGMAAWHTNATDATGGAHRGRVMLEACNGDGGGKACQAEHPRVWTCGIAAQRVVD
jgi:hypothetical protein